MTTLLERVQSVVADKLSVDESEVVPEASFSEDLNADSPDKTEGKKDKIKYTPHGDEKEVELAEDHSDELYEITLDPETNKPSKIEKI